MNSDSKVNLGVVQLHKGVVADICSAALQEVQGVTIARNDSWDALLAIFGVKHHSGVDVRVDSRGQVSVVIKVNIRYGLNLADTSRRIQDVVMTAVEKMADINLKDVDVSIQGIERG